MEFEVLTENINKFIPLLLKTLPVRPPVPILSNLFIEVKREGVFLCTTDLEFGVRVKIPAKIEKEGGVTIPGKQFLEILSFLQKGKAKIIQKQDTVTFSLQRNKILFQTMPKEEFPSLFKEKGEKVYTLGVDEFGDAFTNLIFAVSADEARPTLTGVFFSQKESHLDLVATDGYRMSLRRKKDKKILIPGSGLIIPARLINEVLSLKEEESVDMYVYHEGNQVLFEAGDVVFVGRLVGGEFPNYEKVIPTENKTRIVIDKDELLQSVRVSSIFARENANIIRFKVEDGVLRLYSRSSGIGEGEVVLDVEQKGGDNEIAFNIKFLLDLLRNIEGERIILEMNSPLEPALFKVEKDEEFLHVIMPVRVQE